MKMNVSQEEAKQCVEKVKERQMGYLFENMEKMDIQAERRNTAEARKQAEEAKNLAIEAAEKAIQAVVSLCQEFQTTKDTAVKQVMEKCSLSQSEAEEKVNRYWKE